MAPRFPASPGLWSDAWWWHGRSTSTAPGSLSLLESPAMLLSGPKDISDGRPPTTYPPRDRLSCLLASFCATRATKASLVRDARAVASRLRVDCRHAIRVRLCACMPPAQERESPATFVFPVHHRSLSFFDIIGFLSAASRRGSPPRACAAPYSHSISTTTKQRCVSEDTQDAATARSSSPRSSETLLYPPSPPPPQCPRAPLPLPPCASCPTCVTAG